MAGNNRYGSSKSRFSNDRVKIKGRYVFVDDVKVAEIRGWRNPYSGGHHVPFKIYCLNGTVIGNYGYAVDAQRYCRESPEFIEWSKISEKSS